MFKQEGPEKYIDSISLFRNNKSGKMCFQSLVDSRMHLRRIPGPRFLKLTGERGWHNVLLLQCRGGGLGDCKWMEVVAFRVGLSVE